MVYTPQQNVVVERKRRHLLDTARALKFYAAFLDKFWRDCVLTTAFLINKMPMKILYWKSPFVVLYGTSPSNDSLRTIGCLCYATVTKPHKNKFTPRTVRCVLIGYPPEQSYSLVIQLCPSLETTGEDVVPDCHLQNNNKADENDHIPNTPDERTIDEPEEPYAEVPSPIPLSVLTRRSTRASSQPTWLKDFVVAKHKASMAAVVSKAIKQPLYPLFKDKVFDDYPSDCVVFLAQVLASVEHVHYSQATADSKWVEEESLTMALVYVDDILITGNNDQVIMDTKLALDKKLTFKVLGLRLPNTYPCLGLSGIEATGDILLNSWIATLRKCLLLSNIRSRCRSYRANILSVCSVDVVRPVSGSQMPIRECDIRRVHLEIPRFHPLVQKDPERANVITMSEYLRLPFLSGMTIEAGRALTAHDVIPQHTTSPLSSDEPIPAKTDSQRRVEASDPKIVATRVRKAQAAAKRKAGKHKGSEGVGADGAGSSLPPPLFVPTWGIHQRSRVTTPEECRDLMANLTPPGVQEEMHVLDNNLVLDRHLVLPCPRATSSTLYSERHRKLRYEHYAPCSENLANARAER
ncbi:retrovirus-related pol polyprotein from transposon TNT 1-94 [Tanacetum coccineum]